MKTYKNDFTSFTLKKEKCYKISDDFAIANYKIKQLGKNIIKAQIIDDDVFKSVGGIIDIEVCMIDKVKKLN